MMYKPSDLGSKLNCLCTSTLVAVHPEQFPDPEGLDCRICLQPIDELRCCCCCYQLSWPGLSSVPDPCELVGTDPYDVWLGETDEQCTPYNNNNPRCVWGDSYWGSPTFTLDLLYDATTKIVTATLTVVITPLSGSHLASFVYLSTDFTCIDGGTFNLTSFNNTSTCTGFSYPTVLSVSPDNCFNNPHHRGYCVDLTGIDMLNFFIVSGLVIDVQSTGDCPIVPDPTHSVACLAFSIPIHSSDPSALGHCISERSSGMDGTPFADVNVRCVVVRGKGPRIELSLSRRTDGYIEYLGYFKLEQGDTQADVAVGGRGAVLRLSW